MKLTIAALVATLTLSACVHIGNKFDMAQAHALKPGISTSKDAIATLGKPTSTSASVNNGTLLQWMYTSSTVLGAHSSHVAILFDADGKMVKITHETEL